MMIHKDKALLRMDKVVHRTIQWLRSVGVFLFAVILLGSCVKDELFNTPHPGKGAVKITTDWSDISEDAVQPENYQLRIGEAIQSVSTVENIFKELLPHATHSLLVHNQPRGFTVGMLTATVNTLVDGTLEPMPSYLFSAMQELNVLKDDTLKVNVKMIQAGRKLTLLLRLKAGDAERIASSTATLVGIAHTVDLATGKPTSPQAGGTLIPTFVKTAVTPLRAAEINALTATVQPVGVVKGERQLFKIVVTLTDGTITTVESDLTEALKHFDSDNRPLTLDAELSLPDDKVEGSFDGTISDWTVIENDDVTIH